MKKNLPQKSQNFPRNFEKHSSIVQHYKRTAFLSFFHLIDIVEAHVECVLSTYRDIFSRFFTLGYYNICLFFISTKSLKPYIYRYLRTRVEINKVRNSQNRFFRWFRVSPTQKISTGISSNLVAKFNLVSSRSRFSFHENGTRDEISRLAPICRYVKKKEYLMCSYPAYLCVYLILL